MYLVTATMGDLPTSKTFPRKLVGRCLHEHERKGQSCPARGCHGHLVVVPPHPHRGVLACCADATPQAITPSLDNWCSRADRDQVGLFHTGVSKVGMQSTTMQQLAIQISCHVDVVCAQSGWGSLVTPTGGAADSAVVRAM